jgi:hypothetical protein
MASLLGSMPAFGVPVQAQVGGPLNVVGFGSCGGRLVRRLIEERRGVTDGDYIEAEENFAEQGYSSRETLGTVDDPHKRRPLVLVTAAGGRGADWAWKMRIATVDTDLPGLDAGTSTRSIPGLAREMNVAATCVRYRTDSDSRKH